jgi:endo-1,4-beta-xylanase
MATSRTTTGRRWRGVLVLGALVGGLLGPGMMGSGAAATVTVDTSPVGVSEAPETLRDAVSGTGFRIGAAVADSPLNNDSSYRATLAREFNAVTPENAMKWDAIEPSRGQFSFAAADRIVSAARQNGQDVYGHALVWHSQLPGWVSNLGASELRSAMLNHIEVVGRHFAGQVRAWDVVNEVFNENGTRRNSVFQQKLGNGYIAEAFRAASAADPAAKLYINDYNVEGINAKSNAMYDLVRQLLADGVPVDGVGLQAHFVVGGVPQDLRQNIQRFADLGLEVKITELDVRIPTPADSGELAQQATDYATVTETCLQVGNCVGVTTWGITDRYSWVPDVFPGYGAALVFNESYAKKPAYSALLESLGGSAGPGDPEEPGDPGDPAGECTVDYVLQNEWNSGYVAQLTVHNTGSANLSGWSLSFTNPNGQRVTSGWNASVSQQAGLVTATGSGWNGSIAAGGSVNFGFQGTLSGPHVTPTQFQLNGTACS